MNGLPKPLNHASASAAYAHQGCICKATAQQVFTKVLPTAMMLHAIARSPITVTTGEPTKAADPAPTTIAKRAVKVYVARMPLSSGLSDGSWLMQGTLAPHDALAHVSGKSHG
jgi:hypothetical protein